MTCEWCGHEHERQALCTSRPKWSRRGFLSLFGAGVAGLAVAPLAPPFTLTKTEVVEQLWQAHVVTGNGTLDALLKQYYEPVIVELLNDQGVLMRHIMPRKNVPLLHRGETLRVHAR